MGADEFGICLSRDELSVFDCEFVILACLGLWCLVHTAPLPFGSAAQFPNKAHTQSNKSRLSSPKCSLGPTTSSTIGALLITPSTKGTLTSQEDVAHSLATR
jgi:hypothetical protein